MSHIFFYSSQLMMHADILFLILELELRLSPFKLDKETQVGRVIEKTLKK